MGAYRSFEEELALGAIEQAILPEIAQLLETLLEAAAEGRHGDQAAQAAALREAAAAVERLPATVARFAPAQPDPPPSTDA